MVDPKAMTELRRKIGRHVAATGDQELRWILRDRRFRRDWMGDHEIPRSAPTEDYVKKRAGAKLGFWDLKTKEVIIDA